METNVSIIPHPWLWLSAAAYNFLMMFSPSIGQQEWFDQVFLAMIGRKRRLTAFFQQMRSISVS
jgi:hypothetical protein